jgi:predicted transcriptional regulator
MPTITVKTSEAFFARWQELPESERDIYAIADLVDEFEENQPHPTTEEDLRIIGEALADADAGRVVDRETFFAEIDSWCESLKKARK